MSKRPGRGSKIFGCLVREVRRWIYPRYNKHAVGHESAQLRMTDAFATPNIGALRATISSFSTSTEGIAYDSVTQRFLLGSMFDPAGIKVRAVPYFKGTLAPSFTTDEETEVVFAANISRTHGFMTAAGMKMRPGTRDLWIAASTVFEVPPNPNLSCGIVRANLEYPEDYESILLDQFKTQDAPACFTNDLTFSPDGQRLFVTDFFGYRVYHVNVTSGVAGLLSGDIAGLRHPTAPGPFNGPNGIAMMGNDALVIAVATNQMTRAAVGSGDPSTWTLSVVDFPENASVAGLDGIIADPSDARLLYGGAYGTSNVLWSGDSWASARLVTRVAQRCVASETGITTNTVTDSEVAVLCNNGFGPAPCTSPHLAPQSALAPFVVVDARACRALAACRFHPRVPPVQQGVVRAAARPHARPRRPIQHVRLLEHRLRPTPSAAHPSVH